MGSENLFQFHEKLPPSTRVLQALKQGKVNEVLSFLTTRGDALTQSDCKQIKRVTDLYIDFITGDGSEPPAENSPLWQINEILLKKGYGQ